MIDKVFWEEVQKMWVVKAPPKIKNVKIGSGGTIDPSLLKDPWEIDDISFEFESIPESSQEDIVEEKPKSNKNIKGIDTGQIAQAEFIPSIASSGNIYRKKDLDKSKIEEIIVSRNLDDYSFACKMIVEFGTTERIDNLYGELKGRILVLREALDKFKDKYKDIYQPKMFRFYEYYFPEMIRITMSYIEYAELDIGDEIKIEVEDSTVSAVERVLNVVNDIIDNIYRYASMDLKARSKALGSKMELDGHTFNGIKIDG